VRTLQFGAYRVAQRCIVLDITHLMILDANTVVAPATDDELTFDFSTPDEVASLIGDDASGLDGAMVDRMSHDGDFCLAAFANNQLAGYAWFAFEQVEPECNQGESLLTGVGLSLPLSMCFMYKGFVHREFRGRRVYGRLLSRALTLLFGRKITHLLSTADWANFSAHKSCYGIGFRHLGLVWRFGYPRRMFTVTPNTAKPLGIRFLKNADTEGSSTVGSQLASTLPGGRGGV
jgi:GNAT superfamily N-acetyltransferase